MKKQNSFIITIDTEGDNIWSAKEHVTTKNSAFVWRFQDLCESYNFKTTWLVNYEMARDQRFVDFGRDILRRNVGEIGMHLHAWNSPPHKPLSETDWREMPFLIEYSTEVMREKIEFMTDLLEDTFGTKMRSHRAGRWAMDSRYLAILAELGYECDCSVTPLVDWSMHSRSASGRDGINYTAYPVRPYFMDDVDLSQPGHSLLQVPMTIRMLQWPFVGKLAQQFPRASLPRRTLNYFFREKAWMRPDGRNLRAMLRLEQQVRMEGCEHLEFMLHSSELMPGGSPTFKNNAAIERLYGDLNVLFKRIAEFWKGDTISEFRAHYGSP